LSPRPPGKQKQRQKAKEGDNESSQPWAVQMEARAKWDAWAKNKGMSGEDARKAYIAKATEVFAAYA
jgi:diazepam-binding inhibitor (GABA receptor modulator, acyl-CoA-binding protein)